jgi:hypothetical protein
VDTAMNEDPRPSLTLFHLFVMTCFVLPVIGAWAEAKIFKAGFGGYAVVLSAGLLLGIGCAYGMFETVLRVAAKTDQPWNSIYSVAPFIAAVAWTLAALFLGIFVASFLLRLW